MENSLQSVAKSPNETKNIKEKVSFNTAIHIFYGYPNGTAGTIYFSNWNVRFPWEW